MALPIDPPHWRPKHTCSKQLPFSFESIITFLLISQKLHTWATISANNNNAKHNYSIQREQDLNIYNNKNHVSWQSWKWFVLRSNKRNRRRHTQWKCFGNDGPFEYHPNQLGTPRYVLYTCYYTILPSSAYKISATAAAAAAGGVRRRAVSLCAFIVNYLLTIFFFLAFFVVETQV